MQRPALKCPSGKFWTFDCERSHILLCFVGIRIYTIDADLGGRGAVFTTAKVDVQQIKDVKVSIGSSFGSAKIF